MEKLLENYAYIEVTTTVDFSNGEKSYSYRWIGKDHVEIVISDEFLEQIGVQVECKIGSKFSLGDYPLMIIDTLPYYNEIWCIRTDVVYGLVGLYYVILDKVKHLRVLWRKLLNKLGIINVLFGERWF